MSYFTGRDLCSSNSLRQMEVELLLNGWDAVPIGLTSLHAM